MARLSARKSWLAGGIGLGACALAGAAWLAVQQHRLPAAPATTAAPVLAPAPAAKPGAPSTSGKGGTPPKGSENPSWNKLSIAQQEALQPLAGEWNKLEALRKQKWLDIAKRFASMSADEQTRVHERMRVWVKLTPEQRRLVRENYARTKKIDPGQKTAQWEQYQQLPEDQKKSWRRNWCRRSHWKKCRRLIPTPANRPRRWRPSRRQRPSSSHLSCRLRQPPCR
ncbi:hypothetical protein BA896_017245 [Janthinobacterium lividum]|uniref:DUF3106 domain-containing protein n=1 Tax=Janthinobacterium lividum TaxID=29581 RepID=A0A1E8PME5_9BURK|nr:hypothetical protein BA896_017245 [Janthinobacterium lividum]